MIPVTTTSARRTLVIAFSTAVAAAVATGACGSDEPEFRGPVDGDTYVTVMGELADLDRFPPSGSDEAARAERADSVRRAILERHGVAAAELLEFAETAGARPHLMVELTDRIVALSDSLARRRTGAGRAADSAAARDLGLDPDRGPVTDRTSEPATDPGSEPPADRGPDSVGARAARAADSTLPMGLDSQLLRQRGGKLGDRTGAEREPSP